MYTPTDKQLKQLDKAFTYRPPKEDQPRRYEKIRSNARELAKLLIISCPESRELSLALTKLEESVMHANAAIERNE